MLRRWAICAGRHRLRLPRGLRARLTATYTLAAALLTVAGAALFLFLLTAGLRSNLDGDLATRADTLATALQDNTDALVTLPERPPLHSGVPDTLDLYRSPTGRLISATGVAVPPLTLPPDLGNPNVRGSSRGSVTLGRTEYRLAAVSVQRAGGTWLAIAGASRASNDEAVEEVARRLLLAGPFLIVFVAAGTWLLGGAALRPVDRMRRDAAALSAQPGAGRLRVDAGIDHQRTAARARFGRLCSSITERRMSSSVRVGRKSISLRALVQSGTRRCRSSYPAPMPCS